MPIELPPNPFLTRLKKKYQWHTHGEVDCPICASLRGRIYTYDVWYSIGMVPGFHLGCDCSLKLVSADAPMDNLDFFGGADLDLFYNILRGPLSWMQWNPDYKPYARSMFEELEAIHKRLGPDAPMHKVIDEWNRGVYKGFRYSSWGDRFFFWRVFKTLYPANPTLKGKIEGMKPNQGAFWYLVDPFLKADHIPKWDPNKAQGTYLSDFQVPFPRPDNIRRRHLSVSGRLNIFIGR